MVENVDVRGVEKRKRRCSSCVEKCVMVRGMIIKPVFTRVLEDGFMAIWDMKPEGMRAV